jgi:MEDS: MEthanogen/methylotroph, DcmR Sensory domain
MKSSSHGSQGSGDAIRFAGSVLGDVRHVCGFFRNADEEYQLLMPFIKEGFERGEKAFHVVDPKLQSQHLRRLAAAGIDVKKAAQLGQLELYDWNQAYFPDGRFDQKRMLAMWDDVFLKAQHQGFPLTRLLAHMEWSLEDRDGVNDLVEYESRFNQLHQGSQNPVVCAYELGRYPGDVVVDILRTHPMIIIGGVLQENPFFVPPDEFLAELQERRARQGSQRAN